MNSLFDDLHASAYINPAQAREMHRLDLTIKSLELEFKKDCQHGTALLPLLPSLHQLFSVEGKFKNTSIAFTLNDPLSMGCDKNHLF